MFKKYPAIFSGLVITLLFFGIGYVRMEFIDSLELKLYDLRMKLKGEDSQAKGEPDQIVLINIDDDSVEKIGRWPWPRSYIAKSINKINEAGPRIIGLNVIYSEAEESEALRELKYLSDRLTEMISEPAAIQLINDTMLNLDNDKSLATSIQNSGKVVLPVFLKKTSMTDKEKIQKKLQILKDQNQTIQIKNPEAWNLPFGDDIIIPIPRFFESSGGVGHVNLTPDFDGKVRREQLFYQYQGVYIPSFSLRITALYHNIPNNEIQIVEKNIGLRHLKIPMNSGSEFLVSFKGKSGAFKHISFADIYYDKIPSNVLKDLLRDKIVLITPSAAGIFNPISTPTAHALSVGEFTANAIWSMLHRRFIQKPSWDRFAWLVMTMLVGGVIIFLLPRLKALLAAGAFAGVSVLLIAVSSFLFVSKGLWVQITYPLLHLICGYIGVVSIKYFVTETHKEKIEGESAESNRSLGLAYQSQGMLDMAFEKFRKVPVDDETKRILYDLAKDFERKRLFNKAVSVYEYIEEYDSAYKDIAQKKKRLVQASETMIFGDGFLGGGTQNDGIQLTEGAERPKLGRYEVIKQLGKGAMGVVYLGEDPTINRKTAIKTFRLGDGFDPEDVKDLKKKFFREAESAGTLSHPNIVTIYDAGEEQDLAFISMEFLEGDDLQKYTKKNNLLPMRKVLDYVADIAEGLDYAHQKGIIHRDIKPANVMLLKTGVVKITDFGIARITASSQTQTGVVKGTPHYMSPEQISGEKVDGRSDIFSLGAMLFQLLTGDVPFHGDSPAALMHQIMNVPHPDPRTLNPKLLKPHVTIIDKALDKDRDKRYQRGSQMAAHLRMLGKKLDEIVKKNKG